MKKQNTTVEKQTKKNKIGIQSPEPTTKLAKLKKGETLEKYSNINSTKVYNFFLKESN